jgi:glc operon protein GlcG
MAIKSFLFAAALAALGGRASAATKPVLTLDEAQKLVAAAVDYAHQNKAPGAAIAVVDDGGSIVLLERLDGTFPSGPNISIGKARTAAGFKRATRDIENAINKGRFTMTALPAVTTFTPLQGGVPLIVQGQVVGAVGVSGASSAQQDDDIAQAAADAFTAASNNHAQVEHIPADTVRRAFKNGMPLLANDEYKVNASRRDVAGEAEAHLSDTDIFYVLGGGAEFITGGRVIDPVNISPLEVRGKSLEGGSAQSLSKGDVISVPRGVPHWFKRVTPPFTYYVVKTTAAGG